MTELSYVMRRGYELCGVYDGDASNKTRVDPNLLLRHESTAEHSARVANLFSEIVLWYPMYFSGVDTFLATKVALNHDVGEVKVGDICDDGSEAHDLKQDAEWQAVKDFYSNLPQDIQEQIMTYHRQFENSETLLGQMLRMADKLDAIGRLILYERQGLSGDIYRKNPPSEQDLQFAREIGTGNCVDVWGLHMLRLFERRNFKAQVVSVAKDFLTVGLASIDREFFPWWKS